MDISNNYYGRKMVTKYKNSSNSRICTLMVEHVVNKKLKRIKVYSKKKSSKYPYDKYWDSYRKKYIGRKYVGYYTSTSDGGLLNKQLYSNINFAQYVKFFDELLDCKIH